MKQLVELSTVGALLIAFLATSHAQSTNGLAAYYPLDGNASDARGHNQNATAYNGITYAPHLAGLAAHFSGEFQYISLPETIPSNPNLTVAFWMKTSASSFNTFPWGLFLVSIAGQRRI